MSKTLTIIKDKTDAIAFTDTDRNVCEQIVSLPFHINTGHVLVADSLSEHFDGSLFYFEKIVKAQENAEKFYALLKKYGNIPCSMCGARLKIEKNQVYCTNPRPDIPETTYRSNKACPFRTDLDHFLED
jgi:hypothetical protein